jgi:hypothetical protein
MIHKKLQTSVFRLCECFFSSTPSYVYYLFGLKGVDYLLIAQSLLTESSKISCPESCFFSLDPSEVPLYRTYVLCTQGRCNISLIGRTAVGSLSVFE